jgi:rubrerythrin
MKDEVRICVEILDEAIEFEETGMAFFKERAENAPTDFERRLFQSLAKDEMNHRAHLMRMKEDLVRTDDMAAMSGGDDEEHRSTREIFETAMDEAENPYQADAQELEIIKGAMEVERKGYAMYSAAVEQVSSEKAKAIFRHLAGEEQNHYALLKNSHDYLTDPENFRYYDENPMLDGG